MEHRAREFAPFRRCPRHVEAALLRRAVPEEEGEHLSDGEIHYLWWFIQGSIMEPDVRWRLRRAWGMCERHAWGALMAEAAFRHDFLHGPALLYEDLMERAVRAFRLAGPCRPRRIARRLRATGPCLMCEMGLGRGSPAGPTRPGLLERGRDPGGLRAFTGATSAYWPETVCGRCFGARSNIRCRPHLLEDIGRGDVCDLTEQRGLVERTLRHLAAYSRSFRWECRNSESEEDRAALIIAVGWCSGWRPLIRLAGSRV